MRSPLSPSGVLQDARYAFRAVRRDQGFFVFATLIIGIGVGASTAVYSVMSPLMLAPLPFEDPGQLVWIANDEVGTSLSSVTSRSGNLRDFRESSRSFVGLTGYNAFFNQSSYSLVATEGAEQLLGAGVAHDFLDVLGVRPLYGRNFTAAEGAWEGPAAIILTHGFWLRRFAGDPAVVGTSITLNDIPREVIGVLPETFDFSSVFTPTVSVDFLTTFSVGAETDRWGNTMFMIGRLRPGGTVEAAQSELDGIVAGLQEADPERWGLGAAVSPLQQHIAAPFRPAMILLAAAAAMIMLIACVNLSNMLLARSPRRLAEMAVRRTLGATRGRLVRQLMIESLFLATGGAAVGALVATASTQWVASSSAIAIPMLASVSVDGLALVFALTVALAGGILVAIVPALQVSEGGEAEALKAVSLRSTVGRGGGRLRELLVVSEVALACILLIVGGLLLRSLAAVLDVELGYEPNDAVAWQLNPSPSFETIGEESAFFHQIADRISAIPGVTSVGLIDALPLGKNRTWGGLQVVGEELAEDDDWGGLFPHVIDSRYMETMQIPLLAGRQLSRDDTGDSELVIQINASGAERLFAGQDPIGRLIRFGRSGDWRIVGVVDDVKHQTLEMGSGTQLYFPITQMWDYNTLDLVVRSGLPTEVVATSVSAALLEVDPNMPTNKFWTLSGTVDQAASPRRFTVILLGAFAGAALLLAGIGIYGVLSYSVTERIPEIGIRMALGASGADVRRKVIGRTMFLAVVGVVVGTGFSVIGARLISSLLYGVEPIDPATLIGTVFILLSVSAVSGLLPAIRASRTDSATALRA